MEYGDVEHMAHRPATRQVARRATMPLITVPIMAQTIPAVAIPLPDAPSGILFLALTPNTMPIMLRIRPRIAEIPYVYHAPILSRRPTSPRISAVIALLFRSGSI